MGTRDSVAHVRWLRLGRRARWNDADECDDTFDPDDLPVLLVDVRALCGGTVLEPDARVEARARLRAMLTDEPRDFAARSSELFDAGFALHSTASVAAELVAMLEVRADADADGDADGDADADADGAASGGQQPRPQLEVVAYPSEYYAPRAPGAAEAGSATVSTQALWEQVRNGSARDGWRWRCVASKELSLRGWLRRRRRPPRRLLRPRGVVRVLAGGRRRRHGRWHGRRCCR